MSISVTLPSRAFCDVLLRLQNNCSKNQQNSAIPSYMRLNYRIFPIKVPYRKHGVCMFPVNTHAGSSMSRPLPFTDGTTLPPSLSRSYRAGTGDTNSRKQALISTPKLNPLKTQARNPFSPCSSAAAASPYTCIAHDNKCNSHTSSTYFKTSIDSHGRLGSNRQKHPDSPIHPTTDSPFQCALCLCSKS